LYTPTNLVLVNKHQENWKRYGKMLYPPTHFSPAVAPPRLMTCMHVMQHGEHQHAEAPICNLSALPPHTRASSLDNKDKSSRKPVCCGNCCAKTGMRAGTVARTVEKKMARTDDEFDAFENGAQRGRGRHFARQMRRYHPPPSACTFSLVKGNMGVTPALAILRAP
jgi:hypothetical protein